MTRKRVLFNALSVAAFGGSRSYIRNVVGELSRDDRGLDFTLLAFDGQLGDIDTSGVRVRTLARKAGGALMRVAVEEGWLPFYAREFDLLYCQGDIAPFHGRTPTVVLLRNLNIYDRRWQKTSRTWLLQHAVRFGVRHAARVLFPSQSAADIAARVLPLDSARVEVVPYGISLEAFEDDGAAESDVPYLFLAAAPEPHKNMQVLIDCIPHLDDPSLQVWIAGESDLNPEHRSELEARARALGVADRVRFLGEVPYAHVLRYYRGARAMVFPSLLESFGHPILEAMAAGTPIIASDISTFRENGGDVPLYFPPHDAEALARAVGELGADEPATRARIDRGHARAAHFSWKRHVDQLCAVFDEVLAEN